MRVSADGARVFFFLFSEGQGFVYWLLFIGYTFLTFIILHIIRCL